MEQHTGTRLFCLNKSGWWSQVLQQSEWLISLLAFSGTRLGLRRACGLPENQKVDYEVTGTSTSRKCTRTG